MVRYHLAKHGVRPVLLAGLLLPVLANAFESDLAIVRRQVATQPLPVQLLRCYQRRAGTCEHVEDDLAWLSQMLDHERHLFFGLGTGMFLPPPTSLADQQQAVSVRKTNWRLFLGLDNPDVAESVLASFAASAKLELLNPYIL